MITTRVKSWQNIVTQFFAYDFHAIRLRFFLSWIKPTSRIRDNYHSTILSILRKSNLFSLGGHYKFHKMAESNCDTDYRKHLKIVTTRVKSSQCKCHAILRLRIKPTSIIWDNYHSNSILPMRKLNLFRLRWHN